jgi:hypothetical protein
VAEISPPLREDDGKPISVLKFSMVEILRQAVLGKIFGLEQPSLTKWTQTNRLYRKRSVIPRMFLCKTKSDSTHKSLKFNT